MKRLVLALVVLVGMAAGPASAADLCVGGGGGGCFGTLQGALGAAGDGDTIHVGIGTFAGGVTIDKSVMLVGSGAAVTTIAGGGPVLTIFRETDPEGLTVSIRGVTITGGVNDSKPDPEITFGGGIWIPTSQLQEPPFNGTGATVTIAHSVITGNTVMSRAAIPPFVFCGPLPCGFNTGGGIDNGGVLTIVGSRITNNTAGSTPSLATLASGVGSGGIASRFAATLVLRRSVVSGNRAVATLPNGQNASVGGVGAVGGLTIEDSVISDNSAEVSGPPTGAEEDQAALAGGVRVDQFAVEHPRRVIRNTRITGNRAVANVGTAGPLAVAFGGGVLAEAPLLLERALVTDNLVSSRSAGDAVADGGGVEALSDVVIRDSLIARNTVAVDANGAAAAVGGGIANAGTLSLERTHVVGNRVQVRGDGSALPWGDPSAALGGGIWSGSFDGSPPTLTIADSTVTANRLDAPEGFDVRGGGLFTSFPVTLTRTMIAGNKPDGCFGC